MVDHVDISGFWSTTSAPADVDVGLDIIDCSNLWSCTTAAVVPPQPAPPVPAPQVLAAGSWVFPGIDRSVFSRWRREVLEFWIEYFTTVFGMSREDAQARAEEVMGMAKLADMPERNFWQEYRQLMERERRKEELQRLDDDEILLLM